MPGSSSWMPYAPQGVKGDDVDDDDDDDTKISLRVNNPHVVHVYLESSSHHLTRMRYK